MVISIMPNRHPYCFQINLFLQLDHGLHDDYNPYPTFVYTSSPSIQEYTYPKGNYH